MRRRQFNNIATVVLASSAVWAHMKGVAPVPSGAARGAPLFNRVAATSMDPARWRGVTPLALVIPVRAPPVGNACSLQAVDKGATAGAPFARAVTEYRRANVRAIGAWLDGLQG